MPLQSVIAGLGMKAEAKSMGDRSKSIKLYPQR
jgi:hypothetical protein